MSLHHGALRCTLRHQTSTGDSTGRRRHRHCTNWGNSAAPTPCLQRHHPEAGRGLLRQRLPQGLARPHRRQRGAPCLPCSLPLCFLCPCAPCPCAVPASSCGPGAQQRPQLLTHPPVRCCLVECMRAASPPALRHAAETHEGAARTALLLPALKTHARIPAQPCTDKDPSAPRPAHLQETDTSIHL